MGKIKRKDIEKVSSNIALDKEILKSRYAQPSTRIKKRNRREANDELVDSKLTKKILLQARQQQEDLEEEEGLSQISSTAELFNSIDISKDEEKEETDEETISNKDCEEIEEVEISPDDEKAFEAFMPGDPEERANLADIIRDKMTERETEMSSIYPSSKLNLDPNDRVYMVFKSCAKLLAQYRSGKLPKPVKAIPKFHNWEQILYLTEPEKWSAAAMYQATRIFSSNLSVKMAQRFYNLILLPRIRDDISECKKLNCHLYQALKRALFKPAAVFKGMIIPLIESKTCTLREATIIGSVLAKCSIPILDSGAALLVIAQMDYSGASSIFMRVLIEKKYALPFRVINAVVDHFMKFETDKRTLPLMWHQCLLTFVQIYKNDLTAEQQTNILRLITIQTHKHVSPEVRKELVTTDTRPVKNDNID